MPCWACCCCGRSPGQLQAPMVERIAVCQDCCRLARSFLRLATIRWPQSTAPRRPGSALLEVVSPLSALRLAPLVGASPARPTARPASRAVWPRASCAPLAGRASLTKAAGRPGPPSLPALPAGASSGLPPAPMAWFAAPSSPILAPLAGFASREAVPARPAPPSAPTTGSSFLHPLPCSAYHVVCRKTFSACPTGGASLAAAVPLRAYGPVHRAGRG